MRIFDFDEQIAVSKFNYEVHSLHAVTQSMVVTIKLACIHSVGDGYLQIAFGENGHRPPTPFKLRSIVLSYKSVKVSAIALGEISR